MIKIWLYDPWGSGRLEDWAGRLLQIAMKMERNKCHIKTPPNILV